MDKILAVVLIGIILPAQLYAITCYSCSTLTDSKCGDPLNFVTAMRLETCEGSGVCSKIKAVDSVSRGCSMICVEANTDETGMFCCSGDKCNSGTKTSMNLLLVILPLLSTFLTKAQF